MRGGGRGPPAAASAEPLKAVVSFTVLADVVKNVGGGGTVGSGATTAGAIGAAGASTGFAWLTSQLERSAAASPALKLCVPIRV